PEEKPPDAPPPEAPALGTNLVGEDSGLGLVAGAGNGFGNGIGGKGGNGSKYGYYAGQVQRSVVAALKANKATRSAALTLQVRVWADSTGRVVRASLAGSSGNAATDAAIRDQVLTGLQLPAAPPEGMPMPIVMRITAKRPR
ncbi:MAG TPA: TonB family protein, partial [Chthoniobacterales bacterium]